MRKIPFPRLLDNDIKEVSRLPPLSLAVELNVTPPSTATLTIAGETTDIEVGNFIQLYTQEGPTDIFRVSQVRNSFGGNIVLALEHSIKTLADAIIPLAQEEDVTTTATEALAFALSYQNRWKLGTIEIPADLPVTYKHDYTNVYQAVTAILKAFPDYMLTFSQKGTDWVLNVVKKSDVIASECRLSHNVKGLKITVDRTELCTRIYVPGVVDPIDADTIDEWGLVERSLDADSDIGQEELIKKARQHLELHKTPKVTIDLSAVELERITGESRDTFHLGAMCLVCLPKHRTTIKQHIVKKSYPDVYGKPDQVQVTLASEADSTASVIAGLVVDTTVVKKRVVQNSNGLERLKELILEAEDLIELRAKEIALLSEQLTIQSDRINTTAQQITTIAGQVNSQGELISGVQIDINGLEQSYTRLVGSVDQNTNQISGVLESISGLDQRYTLMAGQISTQGELLDGVMLDLDGQAGRIAALADEILLKANKIDLQGYVTASQLETSYAKIADLDSLSAQVTNLTGGLVTAAVLRSTLFTGNQANFTFLTADAFNLGNELVQKRSITMGDVTSSGKALAIGELDLDHSHEVTVDANGNLKLGGVAADGGNFNIAETQFYKDGVSASYADGYDVGFDRAENAYKPTTVSRTGYDTAEKTVTVRVGNAYQDLLTGQVIPATEIYNAGWNECRAAAGSWACLINYYAAGENLYDRDGNLAPGPWYKGTQATRYTLPSPRE